MNGIGSYTSSSSSRLTGLSGFDTESMIKSLMDADKVPVTIMQQKRQVVEWRQDAYRDITTSLRGMKSTYFDVLNTNTNMLSSNAIRALTANSTSSTYVTATASADADLAAHLVKVSQLATADTSISTSAVTKSISGLIANLDLTGKSVMVTLDGVSQEIALADYTGTNPNIQDALQTSLNAAFGLNKISVSYPDGYAIGGVLSFSTVGGAGQLTLSATDNNGLNALGIVAETTNRISPNNTLESLSSLLAVPMVFDGDYVNFTVNGKEFSFAKTTTLSSVMTSINGNSTANVRMTYDEATDKVFIKAKQTGLGDNIQLTETGSNFFAALGISVNAPVTEEGVDAQATVDGQPVVRNSNSFSLNGITYTLNKKHDVADTGETISVVQDFSSTVEKIKGFVEKYNELIDMMNAKTSEKYDRDYMPLTDVQKEAMKDTDIQAWETKAKTGLLQSDSILLKITQDLRRAMSDLVEGSGLTLRDVGLSSVGYQDRGKLTLDENKLREMLQNQPENVQRLMNGVSADVPSYSRSLSAADRATRYNQSGVFQRLSDILDDNISTIRDSNGNKGLLLEKAGIIGDISVADNAIYTELMSYNERIATMLDKLSQKEEAYFKRYSALESALSRMNQQSSWLTSQFSSGG